MKYHTFLVKQAQPSHSSDDGQGGEYLENDWFSAAGGKDKRVVVVNGMSLPRRRRGGGLRWKGFGECGLCERRTCVCAGETRKEFPRGKRTCIVRLATQTRPLSTQLAGRALNLNAQRGRRPVSGLC